MLFFGNCSLRARVRNVGQDDSVQTLEAKYEMSLNGVSFRKPGARVAFGAGRGVRWARGRVVNGMVFRRRKRRAEKKKGTREEQVGEAGERRLGRRSERREKRGSKTRLE